MFEFLDQIDKDVITKLSAIGVGIVGLIRPLMRIWNSRKIDSGYRHIHQVYQQLSDLKSKTNCVRIVVIKSQNGGGLPRPGSTVKQSALYEVCDSDMTPVYGAWQNVPLDEEYAHVLTDVATKGKYGLKTKKIKKSSRLYELTCESDQVQLTRICATKSAVIYMSVHFKNSDLMSDSDLIEIHTTTNKLCGIFSQHHALVKKAGEE